MNAMLRLLTHALVALAAATAAAGPFDRDDTPLYGDGPDVTSVAATADDWLKLGLARYQAGDFKGAIDAFTTGNQLDPRPAFLFAIGQAERRRGDCAAAIVYYERFLASSPPESQAAAAREQRDRCETAVGAAAVAEPTLPAPTVVITVPAEPPPRPAPRAPRPWWKDPVVDAVGGGAVVLTVTGLVLLQSARWLADDAAAATTYDLHADLRDRAMTRHTAGLVTAGAGLALGAAAAVLIWKPWANAPVEVTPTSVAVAGRW